MGFHNSRARGYLRSVERHQRTKARQREELEDGNFKLANFIIGEVLRCIKPTYIDKRKANKYIKPNTKNPTNKN